jgi:hypothetical protein
MGHICFPNVEESYECHETIEPPFKYIEANSETGCFLHYFARGVELSIANSVDRQIVSVGEAPRGRGEWTADYGSTLIRGVVAGDLRWVVVIAFLFAVITGVLG